MCPGVLGRQVSGVGVSMIRNAAEGEPAFARLGFFLGPVARKEAVDDSALVRLRRAPLLLPR